MEDTMAVVFNIQRYSVQDGPGIRSTVFVKGCPLKCQWCSNPESQLKDPEIMFHKALCNVCGKCIDACEQGALCIIDNQLQIDRSRCNVCGDCVSVCSRRGLSLEGQLMTVDKVLGEVRRDKDFYRTSGGGVTVSGGEPLLQPEFVAELFEGCHRLGIHTCLDTCGYASSLSIQKVLPHVDMVLYDLKHMESNTHNLLTGVTNDQIISNALLIDTAGKEMIIRVPLIPGKNTSEENLVTLAEFTHGLRSVKRIDILPYHRFGESKYAALGREYPLKGLGLPTKEEIEHWRMLIESCGLICRVEG